VEKLRRVKGPEKKARREREENEEAKSVLFRRGKKKQRRERRRHLQWNHRGYAPIKRSAEHLASGQERKRGSAGGTGDSRSEQAGKQVRRAPNGNANERRVPKKVGKRSRQQSRDNPPKTSLRENTNDDGENRIHDIQGSEG